MNGVLIFGAGQVAQVFAAYLRENGYNVSAFVVDAEFLPTREEDAPGFDISVANFDLIEKMYPPTHYLFSVGMSFKGLNGPRAAKFEAMRAKGYRPLTFAPNRERMNEEIQLGAGAFIMDGNTVQHRASIGDNTILWSGNHIGHHTKIGKHVFIASHAVIGGAVEIDDYCFIGVNATIRDGVKIGDHCVIGAGALILSDCEPGGVYSPGGTERSKVPSHRLRGI